MAAKKQVSAEQHFHKLATEYDNVNSVIFHFLYEQGTPFTQQTEVVFKGGSINIDFIIFLSSTIFFYATTDIEDPEMGKIKEYCDKNNIKLIIRHVKLDNTNLIASYGAAITLLLSPETKSNLVMC